jgi:phosphoenolpyruvate carboxykinase (ATP)
MQEDTVFGIHIPTQCSGVPKAILQPRETWSDQKAYDTKARQLAQSFQAYFTPLASGLDTAVHAAGPKVY